MKIDPNILWRVNGGWTRNREEIGDFNYKTKYRASIVCRVARIVIDISYPIVREEWCQHLSEEPHNLLGPAVITYKRPIEIRKYFDKLKSNPSYLPKLKARSMNQHWYVDGVFLPNFSITCDIMEYVKKYPEAINLVLQICRANKLIDASLIDIMEKAAAIG